MGVLPTGCTPVGGHRCGTVAVATGVQRGLAGQSDLGPARSMTSAPSGMSTAPSGPTAVIRLPSITTVRPRRTGPPVPSIRVAPVSAMLPASTAT